VQARSSGCRRLTRHRNRGQLRPFQPHACDRLPAVQSHPQIISSVPGPLTDHATAAQGRDVTGSSVSLIPPRPCPALLPHVTYRDGNMAERYSKPVPPRACSTR
jgi:hypothetical protein